MNLVKKNQILDEVLQLMYPDSVTEVLVTELDAILEKLAQMKVQQRRYKEVMKYSHRIRELKEKTDTHLFKANEMSLFTMVPKVIFKTSLICLSPKYEAVMAL